MSEDEKTLKAFEAVASEVALEEAESPVPTGELQSEAALLVDHARKRLAQMRADDRPPPETGGDVDDDEPTPTANLTN